MIGLRDHLDLPHDVELTDAGLRDTVRGILVPLNAAGRSIVTYRSVDAMAAALARTSAIDRASAVRDARAFVLSLNEKCLLNLRPRGGTVALVWRWLSATLVLQSPARWPARRLPLCTERRRSAAASASRAAAPSALGGALIAAAILAVFAPGAALSAAVVVTLATTAHEAGHAAALHGVPAFVARRGLRVRIAHAALPREREAAIAAAGPLAGLAACLAALAIALPLDPMAAAVAGAALAVHALALTTLTPDGRRACAAS